MNISIQQAQLLADIQSPKKDPLRQGDLIRCMLPVISTRIDKSPNDSTERIDSVEYRLANACVLTPTWIISQLQNHRNSEGSQGKYSYWVLVARIHTLDDEESDFYARFLNLFNSDHDSAILSDTDNPGHVYIEGSKRGAEYIQPSLLDLHQLHSLPFDHLIDQISSSFRRPYRLSNDALKVVMDHFKALYDVG